MPIEIENQPLANPFWLGQARAMVPIEIVEITSLVAGGGNQGRMETVRKKVQTGDVCVVFQDEQTYCPRILHCPSGTLLPQFFSDFLLFQDAPKISRVVIAKPGN